MRIALYEPDIPQNTGTILRLCACLGIEAHIVEPAGFPVTDRAFRRAGMDYLDRVALTRHGSFAAFEDMAAQRAAGAGAADHRGRATRYLDHTYGEDQVLMFGRESAGVPEPVHQAADVRLRVPMRRGHALAQRRHGGRHGRRARRCGRQAACRGDNIHAMTRRCSWQR